MNSHAARLREQISQLTERECGHCKRVLPRSAFTGKVWIKSQCKECARMIRSTGTPVKDLPGEEWRAVDGYDNKYWISNLGRVKAHFAKRQKLLKINRRIQYPRVFLTDSEGKSKQWYTHVLIAYAFLGPRPDGHQINHIDGNGQNSALSNLEYVTPSENIKHAFRLGLNRPMQGTLHPKSKLDEQKVRRIRRATKRGELPALAREYGVHESVVYRVAKRQTWVHVSDEDAA